ncbi:MAG: outer membrane lipoprotein chaperone LolA [Burkholderiales bacterium]|nr:outer membrane lipoprotein chaperone LolA [Burkholderiales bacterium]
MRKLILYCLFGNCFADGISSLDLFLQAKSNNMSASFIQTVIGHKKNQVSTGTMNISRPNKFRWRYNNQGNNIGQEIISDGKKVYIVDKELEQVTYKDLGKTLDKSPAMILAGSNAIKNFYNIKNKADANNLEWVELTPKIQNDNNGFQLVAMGFNKTSHNLIQMKFTDNFGGHSQVDFSNLKTDIKYKDNEFKYIVPKGYDILNGN